MPETHLPASRPRACIVVPAYNEAERLDVSALDAYLELDTPVDFILVNDGSSDDTLAILRAAAQRWPERVQVIDLGTNQGKAEAVRRGMLEASACAGIQFAGFWDADWATPLSDIDNFVDCMLQRPSVDIVLGARVALLGRHIQRSAVRHYLGRVAATAASLVLWLPVYDTQCGAKLIRLTQSTRQLFVTPFESRWVFDVELIARYCKVGNAAGGLYEVPLDRWCDVGESKVAPLDFIRAFGEMARIYRNYRLPRRYHGVFDLLTAPFSRYVAGGAIGTAVHYSLLTLFVEVIGGAPAIGAVLGACAGAAVNYLFNYHLIFVSRRAHQETLPRFLLVAALCVALNGVVVQLGILELGVHYLWAQVIATAIVLLTGFALNKLWTFGRR